MKTYIGIKTVKAEPMTEGEAHSKGFAREDKGREGYHVEYANPDGSTYESWSPKDVFEEAYKSANDFKERMVIEYKQLRERRLKLKNTLAQEDITRAKVGNLQFATMIEQHAAMAAYENVLARRLADLGIETYVKDEAL